MLDDLAPCDGAGRDLVHVDLRLPAAGVGIGGGAGGVCRGGDDEEGVGPTGLERVDLGPHVARVAGVVFGLADDHRDLVTKSAPEALPAVLAICVVLVEDRDL